MSAKEGSIDPGFFVDLDGKTMPLPERVTAWRLPCPAWEDGQHLFERHSTFDGSPVVRTEAKRCACGETVKRTGPAPGVQAHIPNVTVSVNGSSATEKAPAKP